MSKKHEEEKAETAEPKANANANVLQDIQALADAGTATADGLRRLGAVAKVTLDRRSYDSEFAREHFTAEAIELLEVRRAKIVESLVAVRETTEALTRDLRTILETPVKIRRENLVERPR